MTLNGVNGHYTCTEVREVEFRIVIRLIFRIHDKRYVVETITIKANIMI